VVVTAGAVAVVLVPEVVVVETASTGELVSIPE
jgi:hypothetical protein